MPMYDPISGDIIETEEERKRREEAATTEVGKTTIKTYADGSQTRSVTQEIPAAGAVDPREIYNRMVKVESGNRQFTPQGQVVTSPKGAMGVGQIMPATAMQPGYGVPSIFDLAQQRGIAFANRDEASARELLANEQLNREFGFNYANAMMKRFGPEAGVAAYNAGPGRIQSNIQANQGQLAVNQLPQETQQYMARVMGSQPQPAGTQAAAQAQTAEQPLSKAEQAATSGLYSLGREGGSLTPRLPGMGDLRYGEVTPANVQPTQTAAAQAQYQGIQFQNIQDDIKQLNNLIDNPDAPEYLRRRAADRRYELINDAHQAEKAKSKLATLTPTEAGRLLSTTPKDTEGSYLKMLLLGFISPQLAGAEAIKLGLAPTKWQNAIITDDNGKEINVEVQTRADGKILQGNIAGTGEALTPEQLQQAAGGVSIGKGFKPEISGTAYVKKDANGNIIARGVRTTQVVGNTTKTYIESGGKKFDINQGWEPESISTSLEKAAGTKQINLAWDPIIAAATAGAKELGEANAKYGTNFAIVGYGPPGAPNAGKPILVDQNTNQIVRPNAQGQVSVAAGATTAGGTAALATGEKLRGERSQALNKVLDEEVRPQAQAGDTVSSVRKQQFAMFNRPDVDMNKIFGLATGAGAAPGDQKWTIVRDIITSRVAKNPDGTPMTADQLSQRLAGLNLTPAEQSVLAEYNISNARINAATLKETAGPGAVTLPEQQMNRERNVDITKVPALAAYNAMAQSQFDGDRARYKGDWASSQSFANALELDREWRKESKRLGDMYMDIARKRIEFINANGNTVNAIKEGYRRFPVPEYDPDTGGWKKTKPLGEILGR